MRRICYHPIVRNKRNKKKKKEEPFCKRRSESKINALCKNVNLIERLYEIMLGKKSHKTRSDDLY